MELLFLRKIYVFISLDINQFTELVKKCGNLVKVRYIK